MLVCLRASLLEEKTSKERKNIMILIPNEQEETGNQKENDATAKCVKKAENAE